MILESNPILQKMKVIIDQNEDKLIRSVQELIRIKSVKGNPISGAPFGEGPARALDKALEISRDLGFRTANLDGYIGYAEYGSGEDYVGVLGHVDVVPEGNDWTYPPYAAQIHEGKIYGRGATDDKGPLMAALYALRAVRDSGCDLSKKVRIIFGTDEESTNADISYYLKKEKAPFLGFTPDAFYPLVYAEKGNIYLDLVKDLLHKPSAIAIHGIEGGNAANMVPDYAEAKISTSDVEELIEECSEFSKKTGYNLRTEKIGNTIIIKSIGLAAHGSTPEEGKNAIMQLLAFLGILPLVPSDFGEIVAFLNQAVDMETNGRSLGLALEDKPSGKLSLNLGIIRMTDEKLSFTLNLRYPVTFKHDIVLDNLRKRISPLGLRIENFRAQGPLYFPLDSILVRKLLSVFKDQTGYEGEPLAIGGGTYAKEMPNTLAFGPIFPGNPLIEHKPNEYIQIDELLLNSKIYAHAIYELAK